MPETNQVKVFYKEIYPVEEKTILGFFKVKRILFDEKLGSELIIESNDNIEPIDAIYFNGKKIYGKKRENI